MMKTYMKNHLLQGVLRTFACLFLLSGTLTAVAQTTEGKAKEQAPQYEMREAIRASGT